jgi:hypothetical protein
MEHTPEIILNILIKFLKNFNRSLLKYRYKMVNICAHLGMGGSRAAPTCYEGTPIFNPVVLIHDCAEKIANSGEICKADHGY